MNIYLKELKSYRKSIIIWSVAIVFMAISGMTKYEAYSSSGQSINELVSGMPKSMRAVLGFSDVDLSTLAGYYSILFIYILLMALVHAVMLGAGIIAKEERDKTDEFLFVKPVSRSKVITAKLMAAFTNVVIFNLVSLISLIAVMGKYNTHGEEVNGDVILTMVGMFILQLLFLSIGSAIAAVKKKPKSAASLGSGILLLTYILSIAIDLNEKLEGLKYFTPFKYFEAKEVMFGDGLEMVYIILSGVMVVLFCIITFIFFNKRDLNA
ncbi:ABC transporter permease subunit [Bacillus massilinigeriensis]|uniref:ABC transporter permease subunit n=1 Tax=Bacillus massilionigeriensis TaxID=1805475 RepID=UPI00096B037C|nr:ABC transporter permease subunit [Bacillus massilionigeriensis]